MDINNTSCPYMVVDYWRITFSTFSRCANVFVSFTTLHMSFKELDVILGDVLTHLGMVNSNTKGSSSSPDAQGKGNDDKQDQLQICKDDESTRALMNIIRLGIFGHNKDIWNPIHALTHCNNLIPLFEHLKGKDRITLAKQTLEKICSPEKVRDAIPTSKSLENEDTLKEKFIEPPSVNALIYLCSILSDSVDALTIEGNVTYHQ